MHAFVVSAIVFVSCGLANEQAADAYQNTTNTGSSPTSGHKYRRLAAMQAFFSALR